MGLKGLYSVLSNEPNRFGSPWESNPLKAIDLYIDAPSLHHHLLSAYKEYFIGKYYGRSQCHADVNNKHHLPPSFLLANSNSQHDDPLFGGLVSPRSVYQLTQAFIEDVRGAIHPNSQIHVVFDGVASPYKRKQQVERMVGVAAICDVAARNFVKGVFSKRYPVVHLWSEEAMRQAVQDLCQEQDGSGSNDDCDGNLRKKSAMLRYHLAPGEAEGYVANEIKCHSTSDLDENHSQHSRRVLVLSSDTDFFVYPSVPGFLPLQRFQFHSSSQHQPGERSCTSDESMSSIQIHAWEYSRHKFLKAFPSLLQCDDDCFSIMVTIAALAGCDYFLATNSSKEHQLSITVARQIIVQSDIGGLRQRDRNNPTAMTTFVAVVRFVGHFVALSSRKSKYGSIGWRDHLVMTVGKGGQQKSSEGRNQLLIEALNIISSIYEEDYCSDRATCTIKGGCYENVDIKRLLMQNVFYCRPLVESSLKTPVNISAKRTIHRSKKKKKRVSSGMSLADHGGTWMEDSFTNFRKRLFYLLLTQREASSSACRISYVTEYSRNRVGDVLDFDDLIKTENKITVGDRKVSWLYKNAFEENWLEFESLPSSTHYALLISSFLSSKIDCLFLLLLLFNQGCYNSANVVTQRLQNIPRRQELLNAFNRVQVAMFHVQLCLDGNPFAIDGEVNEAISVNTDKAFCWNHDVYQSWTIIACFLNKSEREDEMYLKVLNEVQPDQNQNAMQVWCAWTRMSSNKEG